ncbi:AAA family ATPase [Rhizobiales bacterium]|uniref:adenylate/guanylate cyclase domain-containing protein n=1 Tax=Hongsoonwoonella zoysiae TaxID=2821844 RepID=UPI0015604B8C|nr:adenylate/guanylate cyclase domain-containing protein [Hongsoonwoonella zoysiae]NRG16959.1 AAA family ATPase [Hongsoonwoonella zoysiae]
MRCNACRSENPDTGRFCSNCGAPLLRICPACGARCAADAKFCSDCGVELGHKAQPGVVSWRNLRKGSLAEERKIVSILFADLSGSFRLLERDPEKAKELLVGVLDRLTSSVRKFEGTVVQAMGDGIMAIFGAPLAYEDHALRACHAALAIQKEFARKPGKGARSLSVRVGINSGEVVVSERGEGLDLQYAAFGRTAHLAARMEEMASPGTVLVSENTWRLVRDRAQATSKGKVEVRGLEDPVEIYELLSVDSSAGRTSLQGPAVAFVGREAELGILNHAASQAASGEGRVVSIVGEPGVGKSRLIGEFLRMRAPGEWVTMKVCGISHNKPAPYAGVKEILDRIFGFEHEKFRETDNYERHIREKVTQKLQQYDLATDKFTNTLLALYNVKQGAGWEALTADQRQRRLAHILYSLLGKVSRSAAAVIVIDDLQWIDADSQAIVGETIRFIFDLRVLIILGYRPEYSHGWHGNLHYFQIPLDCLKGGSADEFLDALLGREAALKDLRNSLIERTGGNPFFLEESVRSLVEEGYLSSENGKFELSRQIGEQTIPPRVQDVIAMRIDRLPAVEKRLLQDAAAFGYEFESDLLARIADLDDESIWPILEHLIEMHFLMIEAQTERTLLKFKHPLTHDVAYHTMVQGDRRKIHAKILAALEELYRDKSDTVLNKLAFHAEHAADLVKARDYLRAAGRRAMASSACQQASRCFEDCLSVINRMPDKQAVMEDAIDVRLDLRNALMPLGRHDEILPHLSEALALATTLGDRSRIARTHSYLSHYHWLVAEWEDAIREGRQALDIAGNLNDFGLMVTTRFTLGISNYSTGKFKTAADYLSANVKDLEGREVGNRFGMFALPSVVSRCYLALCFAEQGLFKDAQAPVNEAIAIARQYGRPFDVIQGYLALGHVDHIRGKAKPSLPFLEESLALCEEVDIQILVPRVTASLAYAYSLEGRFEEAEKLAERALRQAESMHLTAMRSFCLRWIGEVELNAGRTSKACDIAERLYRHCSATGEVSHGAWARYLLGASMAVEDCREDAISHLRAAKDAAEALGMRPLYALCLKKLGNLLKMEGKGAEAASALQEGETLLHDMGMERG